MAEDRLGGQGNTTFEDVPNPLAPGGKKEVTAAFLNAVISALNSDAFNANTVSGYGIGVAAIDLPTFLATYTGSCLFKHSSGLLAAGGAPTNNNGSGSFIYDSANEVDIFTDYDETTGYRYDGSRTHGSGAITWKTVWSAFSDGNGGEPPAPKPNTIGTSTIGYWYNYETSGTGTWTNPGGTWAYICLRFNGSTYTFTGRAMGVTSGNLSPGSAGELVEIFLWRIA